MFKQFLANFKSTVVDEQERAKDRSFIDVTINLERTLNRTLTGAELTVVWNMSDDQTEFITNLLKEARNGETRST